MKILKTKTNQLSINKFQISKISNLLAICGGANRGDDDDNDTIFDTWQGDN